MNTDLVGERLELRLPVPRCIRLAVEVIERLAVPERALSMAKEGRVALDGDRIGRVRLELDRVGSAVFRHSDEPLRFFEPLVVVGRDLGDDVCRIPWADGPPLN